MKSEKFRENQGKLCMYYQCSVAHQRIALWAHTASALLYVTSCLSGLRAPLFDLQGRQCDNSSGYNFAVL